MPNSLKPQAPKRPKTGRAQRRSRGEMVRATEPTAQFALTIPRNNLLKAILPDKLVASLKYCSSKQYTCGTGGIVGTTNTFALNGLYDPDVTGVGHQPYGFDQMALWYDIYTVKSVKIVLTIANSEDPSNYLAWFVKPNFNNDTLSSSTIEQVSEKELFHWTMINSTTSAVQSQQITLPKFNLPTIEGLSHEAYMGNNNYRASTASNPAYTTSFVLGIGNVAGLSTKSAYITVEMFIDSVWESRKSLPQS